MPSENKELAFRSVGAVKGFEGTGYYINLERACGAYQTAKEFLRGGATTKHQCEDAFYNGRISERVFRWCLFASKWSAHRLASLDQDRCYQKLGYAGLNRRIARVRLLMGIAPLRV